VKGPAGERLFPNLIFAAGQKPSVSLGSGLMLIAPGARCRQLCFRGAGQS
jgi:hypothetical protein